MKLIQGLLYLGQLLILFLGSCFLAGPTVHAQSVNGQGLWFAAFTNGNFSDLGVGKNERIKYWFDAHLRYFDDSDGFGQSIIRPGVGWSLDEESAIWAGYAWIRTSPAGPESTDEHRLWQQWTYTPALGKWKSLFRTRFEQRWLESTDDVGLRLRQLARFQRPFETNDRLSFVAWDELFINMNDTDFGAEAGLGQNRAFVGFGFEPLESSDGRIEVGYLLQSINLPGKNNRQNHILSLNYFF